MSPTTSNQSARRGAPPPVQPASAGGSNGQTQTQANAAHAGVPDWIALAIAKLGVCFEPVTKNYWLQDARGVFIPLSAADIKLRLKDLQYQTHPGGGCQLSQIEYIMLAIQEHHCVEHVGSLAGHNIGIREFNGKRILVKDSPTLVQPRKGQWPITKQLLENMFGSEQLKYLFGWLKVALECLRTQQFRRGQVVALTGPKDCGKSFIQDHIFTPLLGNRSAKPYRYMVGLTQFNSELFGAEHLIIEDEQPSTDLRARHNFGTKIKEIAANATQSFHPKHSNALTLDPFWRGSISVNDEQDNILILPPMEESIKDKITIFKIHKHPMPMPTATLEQCEAFAATIARELPYFAYFLSNEWIIEPDLVSHRYGVREYHNPEVLDQLSALAPESKLLEIIQESDLFVLWIKDQNKNFTKTFRTSWSGSATEFEKK